MSFAQMGRNNDRDRDRGYDRDRGQGGRSGNEYQRLVDRISGNIISMTKNIGNLQKLVNEIGTKKDTHDHRDRVHRVQEQTTNLIRETKEQLKSLPNIPCQSQTEEYKRRQQQKKLSQEFATQIHRFEEVEKIAMKKEKGTIVKARKSLEEDYNKFHDEDDRYGGGYKHDDEEALLRQQKQRQEYVAFDRDIEYNENLIAEREEGIKDIESTLVEVNAIFRDLGNLIHEQRPMLDSIETNVNAVATHVEQGTEELGHAQNYQKKSRNKMCCMLFILLIVLTVIALVVVFTKVI